MKKLTITITAILALTFGAIGIHAQRSSNKRSKPYVSNKKPAKNTGRRGLHGGVYTYKTVKIVKKRHGKYKNTYLHTVFPRGRTKVQLIKSQWIGRQYGRHNNYGRFNNYGPQTYYQTRTVYQGRKAFRVTYKVKRFPNGRTKKTIVRRVRIY